MVQYKKEALKKLMILFFFHYFFFLNIKISEKRLKFSNNKLNNKEFQKSREPTDLLSVDLDQIVVSYRFKHNDKGFKHFT